MQPWMHLASEIIVIDSFSNDGCAEYARTAIAHPNLVVLSHPRGLYQSWNHAIARTTSDWVYISTVGDTITERHLKYLIDCGEENMADVVLSPPNFINHEGKPIPSLQWPLERYINKYNITSPPFVLETCAVLSLSLRYLPMSVLGSSASNLYRGRHLRARPFPTDFGVLGDAAWGLRHLADTRFAVIPVFDSTFRVHTKAYTPESAERMRVIFEALVNEARTLINERFTPARDQDQSALNQTGHRYLTIISEWWVAREAIRRHRGTSKRNWWMSLSGWSARFHKARMNFLLAQCQKTLDRHISKNIRSSKG